VRPQPPKSIAASFRIASVSSESLPFADDGYNKENLACRQTQDSADSVGEGLKAYVELVEIAVIKLLEAVY
jgi:hypothetical protein